MYPYLPDIPRLSILIPCYNEEMTIDATLDAVEQFAERALGSLTVQVVTVDDASRDGTARRLEERAESWEAGELICVRHAQNRGKGAAIQTAREHASGDIVIIQDADLEYDPYDIPALIQPILEGRADAVVGTRFGGAGAHRVLYFWHRMGNGGLTFLSNMFTNLNLTDMEAGYKAFRREVFKLMRLTNQRFGIEPEIVARLSQMGARVYEVPISYHGRTYAEGKKITWRDGVAALGHIVRAYLSARRQPRLPVRYRTPARSMPAVSVR
jgi:glycosyltransferase involved in cell wall biosynthesis